MNNYKVGDRIKLTRLTIDDEARGFYLGQEFIIDNLWYGDIDTVSGYNFLYNQIERVNQSNIDLSSVSNEELINELSKRINND